MTIRCARCEREAEGLAKAPLPTELGRRIQDSICPSCWQEWLRQQVILINEYRLNLVDAEARSALEGQMRQFLNLSGPSQP